MKPPPFQYHAPMTIDEAVRLLRQLDDEEEDAKCLAGGQSLVPMMNLRLARPTHLVDLRRLDELKGVDRDAGGWRIGALATHAALEDATEAFAELPLIPYVASHIGYRAIRSRGTFGGALCHADPVAEWPLVARLLDARMDVVGVDGARVVAAEDFFLTVFTPSIGPAELLRSIRVDRPKPTTGWGFSEFARKVGDYAVVAAGIMLEIEDGLVTSARVALSGVASTPHRSAAAESLLVGGEARSQELHHRAADAAAESIDPVSDLHGTTGFRRQLVRSQVVRALAHATSTSKEAA